MSTRGAIPSLPSQRLRRSLPEIVAEGPPSAVHRAAAGRPVHLVGGMLRDRALGGQGRDWDFVVAGDGEAVARRVAGLLDGRLVALGGGRWDSWRVVAPAATVDLWDRGETDLAADLGRRDLTIHAVALDLASGRLADPWKGLDDLDRRLLRAPIPERAFAEDPLRALRLARFYAELERFDLDAETVRRAAEAGRDLPSVARERIRVELELALETESGERLAEGLRACGLFPRPIPLTEVAAVSDVDRPPPDIGPFALLGRAIRRVEAEGRRLPHRRQPPVARAPLHLATLAAAAAGAGPDAAVASLRERRWIGKETARSAVLVLAWRRPPAADGPLRWLLHSSADLWPTGVAFATALRPGDHLVKRSVDLVRDHGPLLFSTRPWLDGREISRITGEPPGRRLGSLVRTAYRWQIEGEVESAEEARRRIKLRSASAD